MRFLHRLFTIIAVVLLVSACQSGGGGHSGTSKSSSHLPKLDFPADTLSATALAVTTGTGAASSSARGTLAASIAAGRELVALGANDALASVFPDFRDVYNVAVGSTIAVVNGDYSGVLTVDDGSGNQVAIDCVVLAFPLGTADATPTCLEQADADTYSDVMPVSVTKEGGDVEVAYFGVANNDGSVDIMRWDGVDTVASVTERSGPGLTVQAAYGGGKWVAMAGQQPSTAWPPDHIEGFTLSGNAMDGFQIISGYGPDVPLQLSNAAVLPSGLRLVGVNLSTGDVQTIQGGQFTGRMAKNSTDGRYMWKGDFASAWIDSATGRFYRVATGGSDDPGTWAWSAGSSFWTEGRVVGPSGLLYRDNTPFLAKMLFGTQYAVLFDDANSNLLPLSAPNVAVQMVQVTGMGTYQDGVILEGVNANGDSLTIYWSTSIQGVVDPASYPGGYDVTPLDQIIPIGQ